MNSRPRLLKLTGVLYIVVLLLGTYVTDASGNSAKAEEHIEQGKKLLAAGQLAEALAQYHAAIDADPKNYMTYFRRATVLLALGRAKQGLPDLDKALDLKPDFTAARVQRANILMKQGKFIEAEQEYVAVLKKEPGNKDALEYLPKMAGLNSDLITVKGLVASGDWQHAELLLSKIIEAAPWDVQLRELRADCYMHVHEYFKAISDIKVTTKLVGDNTAAFYRISDLHYQLGESDEALSEIRECLKLDPEHGQCYPLYKKLKKLVQQMSSTQELVNNQKWDECIEKANQMLKTEPTVRPYVLKAKSHICHCHAKAGHIDGAMTACQAVLNMDQNNAEAMCDIAEAYIVGEQYEEAVSQYQKVLGVHEGYQRAREGMDRAQKLLKQSKKRDYYKILGVKRTADKSEVMKAYRKLAIKYHPDKYDGDDKKHAEKMFIDIAAAKEVLSDPEKRQKYDQGEDPLDHEQQAGGGHGHPFFHGFNPFGSGSGGNYQFKFHFG